MSNIIERVLYTNIYIQPVHFLLAIITNTLNIRILCCRVLRSSPCTHYFLAYAVFSLVYTCLLCPTQFFRGFSINWANGEIGCKAHVYLLFLIPIQANLMLILASFDRYCSSSKSHRLLSTYNTIRIARMNILFGSLLCILYMLPMLFIYKWNKISKKCLPKFNSIVNIYIFSQVILYYILSPLVIVLFGVLTIYHIRQQSTRALLRIASIRRRRTEGQLARMLLLQVGVHLILVLPFGIIYSINSFVPSTQTSIVIAIRLAFVTWQQCDYFVSFFLYVLSASVYRQQLIRILKSIKCFNRTIRTFSEKQRCVYQEFPLVTINKQPKIGMNDKSV